MITIAMIMMTMIMIMIPSEQLTGYLCLSLLYSGLPKAKTTWRIPME
jgi:hypothetical protein